MLVSGVAKYPVPAAAHTAAANELFRVPAAPVKNKLHKSPAAQAVAFAARRGS